VSCGSHRRGEFPHEVRLHELFRGASEEVRAAALSTVLRHLPRPELKRQRRLFREFVDAEDARFRALSRPSRSIPRAPGPAGEHHDLLAVHARLVASGVARPQAGPLLLTWTARAARRLLGSYAPGAGGDPAVIRVNRALDDRSVPEAMIGYVLHHELLHGEMPSTVVDGRRRLHPPEFRRREREYPGWRELDAWETEHFERLYRRLRRRENAEGRRPRPPAATAAEAREAGNGSDEWRQLSFPWPAGGGREPSPPPPHPAAAPGGPGRAPGEGRRGAAGSGTIASERWPASS